MSKQLKEAQKEGGYRFQLVETKFGKDLLSKIVKKLPDLRELHLTSCIIGVKLEELPLLRSLENLRMVNCQLDEIPRTFAVFLNLKTVDLSGNKLQVHFLQYTTSN
jgi:Leucine-rich repeat (LRR) protein